jgi:hypothetical protein
MKKFKCKEFLYPIDRDWLMNDPKRVSLLEVETPVFKGSRIQGLKSEDVRHYVCRNRLPVRDYIGDDERDGVPGNPERRV